MNDDDLIHGLVDDLSVARRLSAPSLRAGYWAALSLGYVIVAMSLLGPRPDIARVLSDPTSVIEATALLVTSCCAALWAFHRVIPGGPYRPAWLATCIASVIWALSVGWRWSGVHWIAGSACLMRMAVFGVVPMLACIAMLGRARSVEVRSYQLGLLPAGALAMVATQLACAKDSVDHVLIWHAGPLAVVLGLGTLWGRIAERRRYRR